MEQLKIEALVKFNSSTALVLNRMPDFKYQKEGKLLWAKDGPFYSCYYYENPSSTFQAFAGRRFNLPLIGGGVEECTGQWWDGGDGNLSDILGLDIVRATIRTVDDLIDCYVFMGAYCDKSELDRMISEHKGCIYPYWDYEAVIKYKPMRMGYIRKQISEERAKRHLIKKVKFMSAIINSGK